MAVASGEISARRPPLIHLVWVLPAALAILLYLFRDSLILQSDLTDPHGEQERKHVAKAPRDDACDQCRDRCLVSEIERCDQNPLVAGVGDEREP